MSQLSPYSPMLETHEPPQVVNHVTTTVLMVLNVLLSSLLIAIVVIIKQVLTSAKDPLGSNLDHLATQYADGLPESFLPRKYVVDRDYWVTTKNQFSRGTCWSFATIYLLESQYRAQGIREGYIRDNEYVNFSVQGFLSYVGNWCKENSDAKVCQYGGFLHETTNDNQIEALPEFLKAIPDLATSIVPFSVCEYPETQSPDTDFKCDGLGDALKGNPINFTIASMRTVYDERAVKQLLLEAKRPLGIGTPTGTVTYYVECNGSEYAEEDECTKQQHPCPEGQGTYCYPLVVTGHSVDGVFVAPEDIIQITKTGGHAMNVLGYNDEWRYLNRFGVPQALADLKGAFILHNSWGSGGHSIEYLMGQRTLENEEVMCPNHAEPLNWVPAKLSEVISNQGDHTKCTTEKGMRRIRGKGYSKHADRLVCIDTANSACTLDHEYVLGRVGNDVNTSALSNGLHVTEIIDITDKANIVSSSIAYPFHALAHFLKPHPDDLILNDLHDCGFYAFPYKTAEQLRSRNWDLFDNFKVSDIEIKFSPSSYARSPEAKGYNTAYLNASTFEVPKVTFDGPVPFDLVYLSQ